MKFLWTIMILLIPVTAHAQDVTEIEPAAEHLTEWLENAVALEAAVPEGATVYAVNYGTDTNNSSLSTFLREPATGGANRLRILMLPPDQAGADGACGQGEGAATILVAQVTDADTGPLHHIPFCVPYPAAPQPSSSTHSVIEGKPLKLDAWTPVLFYAWLLESEAGSGTDLVLPIDQAFSVQVAFLAGNRTGFPPGPPASIKEIMSSSAISDVVDRYQLIEAR